MEFVAVLIMIAAGIGIAVFVTGAAAISRGEKRRLEELRSRRPSREEIAASLLYSMLVAGGVADEEALRDIRRSAGLVASVTRPIDVPTWGDAYAHVATAAQRQSLIDTAARLVSARNKLVPLLQYVALLDLTFALGFQTDVLARLRDKYAFEYIDHAKDARPRHADRSARTTFFERAEGDEVSWLKILEIEGTPTRQTIVAAYRRKAAEHHPDRFHLASSEVQASAAARFIELTRAYEALLSVYRD